MDNKVNINLIKEKIKQFIDERDWNSYHNPKNLSMSISIEAAELMELFQWVDSSYSFGICNKEDTKTKVKEEIADILIYAMNLCRILEIDVTSSILEKIEKNKLKYPVDAEINFF